MKTLALLGLALLGLAQAQADERILDFHSEIVVGADGAIDVTETYKVRAEGNEIRHGTYRDFPMRYKDRFGNAVVVDFTLLDTLRDGNAEASRKAGKSNGARIYLGDKDTLVDPGIHTWSLHSMGVSDRPRQRACDPAKCGASRAIEGVRAYRRAGR